MEKVNYSVKECIIPTYPEAPAEELPMFSENRVHQRTSGRPYPNKVVLKVDREHKADKKYKLIVLENEYLKIEILPQIGGRIYSALDKTTGYDFFYKQHVIKPALIGVLGSWISGGVEFNWPFHHRASGFMPCDWKIEERMDGSVICWLSDHDPIDRMKGMVGVVLSPGEKRLKTVMRLYNRTDTARSFLWWENAAVPVNEQYQIFFPQDVRYVNFHYLKSRTTFPIAGNGVYNGIPMDKDRDISWHKNTRQATSYFASASDYDFFGGYDHQKQCGVVHIGDHHVSPGKKMFTWAYCQLAKSWENALTDEDGQYAELMAGSYSDNQPDFSWIEPYETKVFTQYWYPISQIGAPTYANLDIAVKIDHELNCLRVQSTKTFTEAALKLFDGEKEIFSAVCNLLPDTCVCYTLDNLPEYVSVSVVANGKTVAYYREKNFDRFNMPQPITDMPSAAGMNSAQELYLAGLHVAQYREPAVEPDSYWKEALKRDINHIPSLIALAKYELDHYNFEQARQYIERGVKALCIFNTRVKSGECYYVYGQILEALEDYEKAADYYHKAAWAADSVQKAMTRIALLDIRNKDYKNAVAHAEKALDYGRNNSLAKAAKVIAGNKLGMDVSEIIGEELADDPLDHFMRYLADKENFFEIIDSNTLEICIDLITDLDTMGLYADIVALLENMLAARPETAQPMALYMLSYYKKLCGKENCGEYEKAERASIGATFPMRALEMKILCDAVKNTGGQKAKMLLGCLLYNKRHYKEAAELWEECDDYISVRNLAVACFSHLGRENEALEFMKKAILLSPDNEQLVYETAVLMDKVGVEPEQKIDFLLAHIFTRDDCCIELAKAYNQNMQPEKAIEILSNHNFVPCEGGEHAVADQYIFAHLIIGREFMSAGKIENALKTFRMGQILPQNLGAGIWNHCKLVPLKYFEAVCLELLGEKGAAESIFHYIAGIKIEYFSNMYLKELPYYQACAWRHLNEDLKAQHLITEYLREWSKIKDTSDNGFFGTTPFFISFMDDPKKMRRAQYCYLISLCRSYMGECDTARILLEESINLQSDNLAAIIFKEQGFLP